MAADALFVVIEHVNDHDHYRLTDEEGAPRCRASRSRGNSRRIARSGRSSANRLKVLVTDDATEDLRHIKAFISARDAAAAESVIDRIRRMLDVLPIGLVVFPGSGITDNLADKAKRLGIPVSDCRKSGEAQALPFLPGRSSSGFAGRTIERIIIRRHVVDADDNHVASAQLAVDRQVEQRQTVPDLQLGSDRLYVAQS